MYLLQDNTRTVKGPYLGHVLSNFMSWLARTLNFSILHQLVLREMSMDSLILDNAKTMFGPFRAMFGLALLLD